MSADFDAMSAAELRRRVAAKDVSPVELTRRALAKAEATQATLNAFFVLMPEKALAAAKAAEDAVMRGEPLGLLHGVPFSAKDLMAVAGVRYASGSRTMANNVAAVDAPAVERAKAAGAILIGKTTTSEFGCKPVGDSPLTGITRHPWNLAEDSGRLERGRGGVGRRRHHAVRARHRWRRLGAHPVLLHRPRRHQGAFRPRAGMARRRRRRHSPMSAPSLATLAMLRSCSRQSAAMTRAIRSAYRRQCRICSAPAAPALPICASPTARHLATPGPIRMSRRSWRMQRARLRILAARSNWLKKFSTKIRPSFGPQSFMPASARDCALSSRRSASCSIRPLPKCSTWRCLRTCAAIMKKCSSDTRCATRSAPSSNLTICCCRRSCRFRRSTSAKTFPITCATATWCPGCFTPIRST